MNPTPCDAAVFTLDGEAIALLPGDTVLQAAARAGRDIPHLCWHADVPPSASCRLCTVLVDGRPVAACTRRAEPGLSVASETPGLREQRLRLLQMLFVEGNHFCPGCEKSGNCLLQAQAARAGMAELYFEELTPNRPVDASHPDVLLDTSRCVLCQLCVRASEALDGKNVFAIGGHGIGSHLLVNSTSGRLGDSDLAVSDRAAHICPVGALMPKRVGFAVPIGQRTYDTPETEQ
jgi:[NiFe] hydrogenase diaphorase moiety small subunit